jgi:hypothetical protein
MVRVGMAFIFIIVGRVALYSSGSISFVVASLGLLSGSGFGNRHLRRTARERNDVAVVDLFPASVDAEGAGPGVGVDFAEEEAEAAAPFVKGKSFAHAFLDAARADAQMRGHVGQEDERLAMRRCWVLDWGSWIFRDEPRSGVPANRLRACRSEPRDLGCCDLSVFRIHIA